MPGKILVSGFEGFGIHRRNPTSSIMLPRLAEARGNIVDTVVLPVEFERAAQELAAAQEELKSAAIVMFGVASSLSPVRLESQARNRNISPIPDNANHMRFGRIIPGGPRTLPTTLPVEPMRDALRDAGVRVRESYDAGTFVCNELLYRTLYDQIVGVTEQVPTGFVHVGTLMGERTLQLAAVAIVDQVQASLPVA